MMQALFDHKKALLSRRPKLQVLAVSVLVFSLWIMVIMVWSQHALHSTSPKSSPNVVSLHQIAHHSLLEELYPDNDADQAFESLVSCYDECNARDKMPTRIGLLVPPGSMGLTMVEYVQTIVRVHSSQSENEVSWIPTSHLPPDAHFFSHIIRFASLPILLAVGDALLDVGKPSELTWVDIEEAAALLVSWHCWISRLATKQTTPIVTITMMQIEDSPLEAETLLRDFLTILDPYEDDPEGHVDTTEMSNSIQQMVDHIRKPLLQLDKKLRKHDKTKNLEVLVNHAIRTHLTEELQCPSTSKQDLYLPKEGTVAQRLYNVMTQESSQYESDLTNCKNDIALAERLFCKALNRPFSIKSLLQAKGKTSG